MRVALPEGQWADLRERLTYGQAREVRAAFLRIKDDPVSAADLDVALIRAYVEAWHVLAIDGTSMALDKLTDAPDDVIQTLSLEAIAIWQGKPDPKDTTKHSATTSQAQL